MLDKLLLGRPWWGCYILNTIKYTAVNVVCDSRRISDIVCDFHEYYI